VVSGIDRSRASTVGLVIAGLGYAWVASGVRTFTHPAEILTGLPIIVVAFMLMRSGRGERDGAGANPARWLAGWAVLLLALSVWELRQLFASPRHDYPTLSSIGDAYLRSSRVAHALAFAAWLGVGWFLVRRWPTRRPS
jgi:hypothetical protein